MALGTTQWVSRTIESCVTNIDTCVSQDTSILRVTNPIHVHLGKEKKKKHIVSANPVEESRDGVDLRSEDPPLSFSPSLLLPASPSDFPFLPHPPISPHLSGLTLFSQLLLWEKGTWLSSLHSYNHTQRRVFPICSRWEKKEKSPNSLLWIPISVCVLVDAAWVGCLASHMCRMGEISCHENFMDGRGEEDFPKGRGLIFAKEGKERCWKFFQKGLPCIVPFINTLKYKVSDKTAVWQELIPSIVKLVFRKLLNSSYKSWKVSVNAGQFYFSPGGSWRKWSLCSHSDGQCAHLDTSLAFLSPWGMWGSLGNKTCILFLIAFPAQGMELGT